MANNKLGPANRRETGGWALKPKDAPDATDGVSQKAAENKKPPFGIGNAENIEDHNEKTRHSDRQRLSRGKQR